MNNDFMPSDIREAADKMGNDFIKAVEFEGEGLILQVSQPMTKIRSNNPQYGAQDGDFLVKQEVLEVGDTFQYIFTDAGGNERKFDSKSAPFFLGFKSVDELKVGDWVKITRTGKTTETRYTIERAEKPTVQAEYPTSADEPAF